MSTMRQPKQKGFTIVELLIVIVVIGILAAITIVAFNGISARAENTKTINAVGEYVKGIHAYAAINGNYPIEAGYPCLGSDSPPTSCARVSGTVACNGIGDTYSQAGFDTKMKTVFSGALPQPSSQAMNCGGSLYGGAYYMASVGKTAQILYFLRGNQLCSGIGGVQLFGRVQQDDTTMCWATLTTLP